MKWKKKSLRTRKTTGMIDSYCNQKFWWLNVDLERGQQYSCCAALPTDIDFLWLEKNPGSLFNTPVLLQERRAMLDNQLVKSCINSCYLPESKGLASRRTLYLGKEKTHHDVVAKPTTINIMLGTTCNLTCVYCCKNYSSAWARDISQSGSYFDSDRFKIFPSDQNRNHQKTQEKSEYNILLDELSKFEQATVHISGGEPFLYDNLSDLIDRISAKQYKINTGLGINPQRFSKQVNKLVNHRNVKILVSAECTGNLYEFVRYGNTWKNFQTNLNYLRQCNLPYQFVSVISNITIHGLVDFYQQNLNDDWHFLFCSDPSFLNLNVLDSTSKAHVKSSIKDCEIPIRDKILHNLEIESREVDRQQFAHYIIEFARRRSLDLSVLPPSLQQWIYDTTNHQN